MLEIVSEAPTLSLLFRMPFFFPFCYYDWVFFASLYSKPLFWFSALSTLLLISYKLFFISFSISFILTHSFFMVSMSVFMMLKFSLSSLCILITSVLNSASSRLLVSILFSSFSGVFFFLFVYLGHDSLSPQFSSLPVFVSMYKEELLHPPGVVEWPYVVYVP